MKKFINLLSLSFICCVFTGTFGLSWQIKLIDPDECLSDIPVFNPSTNPVLPSQTELLLIVWPYLSVNNTIPNGIPHPLQPNEIDIKTEPNHYYFNFYFTLSEEQNSENVIQKLQSITNKIEEMLRWSKENLGPIDDLFRQCNYKVGNSTGRKSEYNLHKCAKYEQRIINLKARIDKWIFNKAPAGLSLTTSNIEKIRKLG